MRYQLTMLKFDLKTIWGTSSLCKPEYDTWRIMIMISTKVNCYDLAKIRAMNKIQIFINIT